LSADRLTGLLRVSHAAYAYLGRALCSCVARARRASTDTVAIPASQGLWLLRHRFLALGHVTLRSSAWMGRERISVSPDFVCVTLISHTPTTTDANNLGLTGLGTSGAFVVLHLSSFAHFTFASIRWSCCVDRPKEDCCESIHGRTGSPHKRWSWKRNAFRIHPRERGFCGILAHVAAR
jgi:hypothetical protein